MWNKAAVGAAVILVAGSMMVYAQQRGPGGFGGPGGAPGGMLGSRMGMGGWHPSPDDMSAFADARIAALHAGLRLNADQEKSWPAFEQALHDFAKMRIDRMTARRDQQQQQQTATNSNPIERLQRRADAMTTRGAALKRLADTAAPLYQSLDDAQKNRFNVLARVLRPHRRMAAMGGERFGGGQRGFGGGERGFGRMQREGFTHREGSPTDGQRGAGATRDEDDYRGPL